MASPEQANATNPEVVQPDALEASGARVPWTTIIASFLVLLFYAGLVGVMYRWTGYLDDTAPAQRDALNKRAELEAGEKAILHTGGLDVATKQFAQIPIDRAMDEVARRAAKKLPFGKSPEEPKKEAAPAPKKEEPKAEIAPNPKTADAPKDGSPKKEPAPPKDDGKTDPPKKDGGKN